MRVPGQGTRSQSARCFAALLAMSLVAVLLGGATIATAPAAEAAVPGAAPANPTVPCTWNWNRWSRPGTFAFPYTDSSFDPTQAVFSQAASALGANGWYQASSAPNFTYSGLAEGVGPGEATTGPKDAEWTYGVGYYVLAPGTQQTISISDSGRQESHAFAFFDSSGNQFDRYPKMSAVSGGAHYIASEAEAKSNPAASGGIGRGKSWSAAVTITVPADGIVYIHYLNFDERIRTQFARISGACGPVAIGDESTGNIPGAPASIDVTANDSNVTKSTVSIVGSDPVSGSLTVEGEGTWSLASESGLITFTPEAGFTTDPSPIRYTIRGLGKVSRPAPVSVTYLPVFSKADDSLGNVTGEEVTIRVTDNDSNVNAQSVAIVGASPNGTLVDQGRGTWRVVNGTITFTPVDGFLGDPRSISYTVNDVGGNPLPAVPVRLSFSPKLENDESLDNLPGDIVTTNVLENDPSTDIDKQTIAIAGADPSGDLLVDFEGMWSIDERTNEIRFIPDAAFAGDPAPIMYTVRDTDGNTSPPAELVVDYLPVTRVDESLGHPAGSIVTIDVLENDPSNDLDPATVKIAHPSYDEATRTLSVPGEGIWSVDPTTGAITSTPQTGVLGEPAPIRYTVEDDDKNVSDPAELIIGFLPIPVAGDDESRDNRIGDSVTINVLENDTSPSDIDPTTVKIIGADPESGVLKLSQEGSWTVDPETGAITFKPRNRFDENPSPIRYVATDYLGVETAPATVTVTYRGVIPEALAFVEPPPIDWTSTFLWGLLAMVLFGASLFLARRPRLARTDLRPRHA